MFELFDYVFDTVSGKPCFVIDIDDHGSEGVVYGLEAEDQNDQDWFRWAEDHEIKKLPERHDDERD